MVKAAFDREDPAEEPPADTHAEVLWRIAVRLYRDHSTSGPHYPPHPLCGNCQQPWPCSGRRLAMLGLRTAAT